MLRMLGLVSQKGLTLEISIRLSQGLKSESSV